MDNFRNENGEKPRKDEDYARNYIRGKYGAIPYLRDFDKLFLTQIEVANENEVLTPYLSFSVNQIWSRRKIPELNRFSSCELKMS